MLYLWWGLPLFAVFVILAVILCIFPALLLRLLGMRRMADRFIYWTARLIANTVLWLVGIRVKMTGDIESIRERDRKGEGFCFVSNHTSMLDVIFMLGQMKVKLGFIAKKQLLFVPFINILIATTHSIFMDRKSLKKSVASIRKAEGYIKRGYSMVIYPEGTRSKTGKIGTFKHGSFRMATESGACIVPVTVKGLRDSLEDRKHCFQRRTCYVHVGDPIKPPKASEREAVSQMISQVETEIKETYETLG